MYESNLALRHGPAVDYARIASYRHTGAVLGSGRGRLLRVAALVAVVLALMSLVFARVAGAESRTTYDTVVVQPGDTLWSIAASRYPSDDPRARVEDIERANHLPDPVVQSGQRLLLPRTS